MKEVLARANRVRDILHEIETLEKFLSLKTQYKHAVVTGKADKKTGSKVIQQNNLNHSFPISVEWAVKWAETRLSELQLILVGVFAEKLEDGQNVS